MITDPMHSMFRAKIHYLRLEVLKLENHIAKYQMEVGNNKLNPIHSMLSIAENALASAVEHFPEESKLSNVEVA